jgi:hypothetical protein
MLIIFLLINLCVADVRPAENNKTTNIVRVKKAK